MVPTVYDLLRYTVESHPRIRVSLIKALPINCLFKPTYSDNRTSHIPPRAKKARSISPVKTEKARANLKRPDAQVGLHVPGRSSLSSLPYRPTSLTIAMKRRWFSFDSPMRGRKIRSRSVLVIPVAGMAAWISAGVGNGWPDGMGVERPAPVIKYRVMRSCKK